MLKLKTYLIAPLLALILFLLIPSIKSGALAQGVLPSDPVLVIPDTVMVANLFGIPGFWMTRTIAEDLHNMQRLSPALKEAVRNYRQTVRQDSILIAELATKILLLNKSMQTKDNIIASIQRQISLSSVQSEAWKSLYHKERFRRRMFTGALITIAAGYFAYQIYATK